MLDINLPDFDGFEVLKAIRILTIVISANSDTKTKQTKTDILKNLITNKKNTTLREDLALNLSKISSQN